MVHFRLKEEADSVEELIPVELEDFGEETMDVLCERVYPVYNKATMEADDALADDETSDIPQQKIDAVFKRLNDALITERNRNRGAKEPVLSKDEKAADLQRRGHRIPKALAERVVREHRRRQIIEMPPASKEPQ
jgi:regulator of sigma D